MKGILFAMQDSFSTKPKMSCALCGKAMSRRQSRNSPVAYFHCESCGRWVASNYRDEALRSNTARLTPTSPMRAVRSVQEVDFDRIKSRLTAFLSAIDERDPYQVLGVSPSASESAVRARFHDLALSHHPDRGGDVAQMQRYTQAYERITHGHISRPPMPANTPPEVRITPRAVAVVKRPGRR